MKFTNPKDAEYFVNNLPKILSGYSPGMYKYIHDMFWATVVREMFVQMHKSFVDRSVTGSDRYGSIWPLLKLRTVRRKSRPHKRDGVMLPASPTPGFVNRDTGRLLNSFEPGWISGSEYVPSSTDQVVKRVGRRLSLTSRVPYVGKVNAVRQLFKEQGSKMLEVAMLRALNAVVPYINRP